MSQVCATSSNNNFPAARSMINEQFNSNTFGGDFDGDFYRRYGNIHESIETIKENNVRNTIDDFFETYEKLNHREKRTLNFVIPTFISDNTNFLLCLDEGKSFGIS